jgi:hypothetical protein
MYEKNLARALELQYLPAVDPVTGNKKPINYYEYGFYVTCVITFAFFVFVCGNCKKIRIAIQIMKTAADFVTEVCSILLVPPVISFLVVVWVLVWAYLARYVWAQGEFT